MEVIVPSTTRIGETVTGIAKYRVGYREEKATVAGNREAHHRLESRCRALPRRAISIRWTTGAGGDRTPSHV
jgi:hypothetical protein